jgi:hypothetical protein
MEENRQPDLAESFRVELGQHGNAVHAGKRVQLFRRSANIREEIVLDRRGNSYKDGDNRPACAQNHRMFRLTGTVSARRITAD